MAQEGNKVEMEVLCKWNGNFVPTASNGKSGVPLMVVLLFRKILAKYGKRPGDTGKTKIRNFL